MSDEEARERDRSRDREEVRSEGRVEGVEAPEENLEEESHVALWTKIEKDLALNVPKYIKNITKLNGYNDAVTFQLINEEIIAEMEVFARDEMIDLMDVGAIKKDYYHLFWNNTSKFKFVSGHKKLILMVSKYVKEKVGDDNKNLSYFTKGYGCSSSKQYLNFVQKSGQKTTKKSHNPSHNQSSNQSHFSSHSQSKRTSKLAPSRSATSSATEDAEEKYADLGGDSEGDRDEDLDHRVNLDLNTASAGLYTLLKNWTKNQKGLEKVMFIKISRKIYREIYLEIYIQILNFRNHS